jgi:allophanate hydrolase subunit 2
MEITMIGPTLKFNAETTISITGADMSPSLNGERINLFKPYIIKNGDILSFGKLKAGLRTYLSVLNGFKTKKIMNSRSMYANITEEFRISKGDKLKIESKINSNNTISLNDFDYLNHFKGPYIEVYKGPEYEKLSIKQQTNLFNKKFTVSNKNNRMAYQINETIENNLDSIITSLVMQGTVQLTPSGKIIVLMRDNQTCGGYPRILQLKESSISKLSQKHMNDGIIFKLI